MKACSIFNRLSIWQFRSASYLGLLTVMMIVAWNFVSAQPKEPPQIRTAQSEQSSDLLPSSGLEEIAADILSASEPPLAPETPEPPDAAAISSDQSPEKTEKEPLLAELTSLKAEQEAMKAELARLRSEHSAKFSDDSNQELEKMRAQLNKLQNQLSYLRKYKSENSLPNNRSKKLINDNWYGNEPTLIRDQLRQLELEKATLNLTWRSFDESLRMRRLNESQTDAKKRKDQMNTLRIAMKLNQKDISRMSSQLQFLQNDLKQKLTLESQQDPDFFRNQSEIWNMSSQLRDAKRKIRDLLRNCSESIPQIKVQQDIITSLQDQLEVLKKPK